MVHRELGPKLPSLQAVVRTAWCMDELYVIDSDGNLIKFGQESSAQWCMAQPEGVGHQIDVRQECLLMADSTHSRERTERRQPVLNRRPHYRPG